MLSMMNQVLEYSIQVGITDYMYRNILHFSVSEIQVDFCIQFKRPMGEQEKCNFVPEKAS